MICFNHVHMCQLIRPSVWTQHYDLHSHSTNSDGEHSADYVAKLMKENAVKYWSLTDHDTISGWPLAEESAKQLGISFIPGVEITCERGIEPNVDELKKQNRERAAKSWHLLAYFPNLTHTSEAAKRFARWLEPLQNNRIPRMKQMIAKLADLGMPIDYEEVARKAGGSIGRPHLAQAMVENGYVDTKFDAFEQWIGDGLPAHVAQPKPSIAEAVQMVKQCGGVTSLAHPLYYGIPCHELAEFCKGVGIDSIEAFHRSHGDEYRYNLWQACKLVDLKISCGSDFHGQSSGHNPGRMAIPKHDLCV